MKNVRKTFVCTIFFVFFIFCSKSIIKNSNATFESYEETEYYISYSGEFDLAPGEIATYNFSVEEGQYLVVYWDANNESSLITLYLDGIEIITSGYYNNSYLLNSTIDPFEVSLENNNVYSVMDGDFEIIHILQDFPNEFFETTELELTNDVPGMGTGLILIPLWLGIAGLGCFSGAIKINNFPVYCLIANIAIIFIWFAGQSITNIALGPNFNSSFAITFGDQDPDFGDFGYEYEIFTIEEGGGIIIYADINFQYDDPYTGYFTVNLFDEELIMIGKVNFGVSSSLTGYERESSYLPLEAGTYTIEVSEGNLPLDRFNIEIRKPGFFTDISVIYLGAIDILFGFLGFVSIIVCIGTIRKNRKTINPAPIPENQQPSWY